MFPVPNLVRSCLVGRQNIGMADAKTEEPVPAEEVELDEKDKKKKKKKRYGGLGGVGSCPTAHGGSFGLALGQLRTCIPFTFLRVRMAFCVLHLCACACICACGRA